METRQPQRGVAQPGLECLTGGQEVAGSNPVAPIIRGNGPFGEDVEGLSYCGDKTYAFEPKVQTDDFEQLTFCLRISTKPFLFQGLRKFKRFDGQIAFLGPSSVACF